MKINKRYNVKKLNIQSLVYKIFDTLNVDRSLITSPSRKRYIVDARRIAVMLSINLIKESNICGMKIGWTYVGECLNRRHSSIWALYDTSPMLLKTDSELRHKYYQCLPLIQNNIVLHRDEFHVES